MGVELAKCTKRRPAQGDGRAVFGKKIFGKKRVGLTQLGRVVNGESHVFDQKNVVRKKGVFAYNKNPGRSQHRHFLKNEDGGTAMATTKR